MAASGEGEVLAANQGTTASLGEHAAIHGTNNQNRNQNRWRDRRDPRCFRYAPV